MEVLLSDLQLIVGMYLVFFLTFPYFHVVNVKSMVKIFSIFVAFSENMNFTKACQKSLKSKSIRAGIESIFYLLQRTALEGSDLKRFASGSKVVSPVST